MSTSSWFGSKNASNWPTERVSGQQQGHEDIGFLGSLGSTPTVFKLASIWSPHSAFVRGIACICRRAANWPKPAKQAVHKHVINTPT